MWSTMKNFRIPIILAGILMMAILAGCEDENRDATRPNAVPQGVELKIVDASDSQEKLIGLTVQATGLDSSNSPVGPTIGPVIIPNPVFPVSVPLTLNEPPCRYQITATATLSQQGTNIASGILDICQESNLSLRLNEWLYEGASGDAFTDKVIDDSTGLTLDDLRDSLMLLVVSSTRELDGLFGKHSLGKIERRKN